MGNENKDKNTEIRKGDLMQILVCIIMIGILLLIEGWLLFYYNGSFVFPLIFGILLIMMFCLHTINMYQFFDKKMKGNSGGEKKAELLIYKKVKSLPEELGEIIQNQVESGLSNLEKSHIKTSKALLKKTEELVNQLKEENENLSGQLQTVLNENVQIKEQFEELKKEQQRIIESIENLALKNEQTSVTEPEMQYEMPVMDSESTDETTDIDSEITDEMPAMEPETTDEMPAAEATDPNKQLSPDEIAALFANV